MRDAVHILRRALADALLDFGRKAAGGSGSGGGGGVLSLGDGQEASDNNGSETHFD